MPGKKLTSQQQESIRKYKDNLLNGFYKMLRENGFYMREESPEVLLEFIHEGHICKPDGSAYDKNISLDEFIYGLYERENQLKAREEYKQSRWELQIEINVDKSKREHYLTLDQINNLRDALQGIYQPFEGSKEYDDFYKVADDILIKSRSELHAHPKTNKFFISDEQFNNLKQYDNSLLDKARNRSLVLKDVLFKGDAGVKVSFADNVSAEERVKITSREIKINKYNAELTESIKTAVSDLLKDLKATDSMFSNDSTEYKNFKSALSQLSEKLENTQISSARDLKEIFKTRFKTGSKGNEEKSVLSCVKSYMDAKKAKDGDLSDRQINRISICERFIYMDGLLSTAENKSPDIGKKFAINTIAHKAFLNELKQHGTAELNSVLKNHNNYTNGMKAYSDSHSNAIKKLGTNGISELEDMSRLSPDKLPSLGSSPNTRDHYVYDFLKERTEVLSEKINSLESSRAPGYREFRKALTKLNKDLADYKYEHSLENLHDILNVVSNAAEHYKNSVAFMNPEDKKSEIDKLEISSEINILSKLTSNKDLRYDGLIKTIRVYHLIKEQYQNQPRANREYSALLSDTGSLFKEMNRKMLSDITLQENFKLMKTSDIRKLVVNDGAQQHEANMQYGKNI